MFYLRAMVTILLFLNISTYAYAYSDDGNYVTKARVIFYETGELGPNVSYEDNGCAAFALVLGTEDVDEFKAELNISRVGKANIQMPVIVTMNRYALACFFGRGAIADSEFTIKGLSGKYLHDIFSEPFWGVSIGGDIFFGAGYKIAYNGNGLWILNGQVDAFSLGIDLSGIEINITPYLERDLERLGSTYFNE